MEKAYEMASLLNGKLTEWQVYKIKVDEMASLLKLKKCQDDQMAS